MNDLEMIKKCAEKMGYDVSTDIHGVVFFRTDGTKQPERHDYDPLHDDAQAMALVKKMQLTICCNWGAADSHKWEAYGENNKSIFNKDLNRAIVECVAKLP